MLNQMRQRLPSGSGVSDIDYANRPPPTFTLTDEAPPYDNNLETSQTPTPTYQESQSQQLQNMHSTPVSRSNSFGHIEPPPPTRNEERNSLKLLGLRFLNARQHFALACCRDLSLMPCLVGLFTSWKEGFSITSDFNSITSARSSEHIMTGIWCIVSAYLSYSILDGLMVRWIVTYSTGAAIVRMLSMSMLMVSMEHLLVSSFLIQGSVYSLHVWILISCILTVTYVIQNFVTSNLALKEKKARTVDFYNVAVFAVVPVGLASFITMIGLLRNLIILRLDIGHNIALASG